MVTIEEYLKKDLDLDNIRRLNDFVDSIINNKEQEAFSIIFATDLHYKSDDKLCFGTIKKLKEMVLCASRVKPDLLVLNGDLTDGHSPKNIILSELAEMFDNLRVLDVPIIINKGNHDSATWFAYENKLSDYVTDDDWNEIISTVTKRNECGYGFLDFDKHKIRVIYLNTSDIINETDEQGKIAYHCRQWYLGIGEKQINWLNDTLSNCPRDYSVIFFSHYIPYDENVENGEQAWEIIKDFNKNNNVPVYMYGHKHRDYAEVKNGIMCICTKNMMNAMITAQDGTEYCATLKDIPVICDEPVLNNPKAHIIGGWEYVEITEKRFKSRRFLNEGLNREISLK